MTNMVVTGTTCLDMQVASKLDPADKETLEKAIDEAIQWLDNNQLAEVSLRYPCSSIARDYVKPSSSVCCASALIMA